MSEHDEIVKVIQYALEEGCRARGVAKCLAAFFHAAPWLANGLLPEEWKAVPTWPTKRMVDRFLAISTGVQEMGDGSLERYGPREEDVYLAWKEAATAAPSGPESATKQIDYRKILAAYIQHVSENEGIDFLDATRYGSGSLDRLSEVEMEALNEIAGRA